MKNFRWLWLSIVVIIIDQISKYFISNHLSFGEIIPITSFFSLTLLHNQGAAFNFLSQTGSIALWLFAIIALVASVFILFWLYKTPLQKKWQSFALALILGGAIGNLIDRFTHGYVIDFLLFHLQQWSWPAFNVADSAVTVGAIMLAIELLFFKKDNHARF